MSAVSPCPAALSTDIRCQPPPVKLFSTPAMQVERLCGQPTGCTPLGVAQQTRPRYLAAYSVLSTWTVGALGKAGEGQGFWSCNIPFR